MATDETVLMSSGFEPGLLDALRRRWSVVYIPTQAEALEQLQRCRHLPLAIVIGNVDPDWPHAPSWPADLAPAHLLLPEVLELDRDLPVIVSTTTYKPAPIMEITRMGAFDYVIEAGREATSEQKERFQQDMMMALERAVRTRKTVLENRRLRLNRVEGQEDPLLHSGSRTMGHVVNMMRKVADTPATVLLTGESGVGKELVARTIHRRSSRATDPFVVLNCGALTESLLNSELFGHVKGAFTGADSNRDGLLREAGKGTLFLDEINSIPPAMQVSLLRVLENRTARPVGGRGEYKIHCRFMAATNADLRSSVSAGSFREDLYYRLHVFDISLPPLRERREDIAMLAQFFADRLSREYGRDVEGIEPAAMAQLESYDWPGNVRELRNVIERAVIVCETRRLRTVDIGRGTGGAVLFGNASSETSYAEGMHRFEAAFLREAVNRAGGNVSAAARSLGMKRPTLTYRLQRLGVQPVNRGSVGFSR